MSSIAIDLVAPLISGEAGQFRENVKYISTATVGKALITSAPLNQESTSLKSRSTPNVVLKFKRLSLISPEDSLNVLPAELHVENDSLILSSSNHAVQMDYEKKLKNLNDSLKLRCKAEQKKAEARECHNLAKQLFLKAPEHVSLIKELQDKEKYLKHRAARDEQKADILERLGKKTALSRSPRILYDLERRACLLSLLSDQDEKITRETLHLNLIKLQEEKLYILYDLKKDLDEEIKVTKTSMKNFYEDQVKDQEDIIRLLAGELELNECKKTNEKSPRQTR